MTEPGLDAEYGGRLGLLCADSLRLAESGMLRQPNARVEKRAFRLAAGDPRWVPVPTAAVTLQARFTCSRHPLTVGSAYHSPLAPAESDKVVLVIRIS